MPLILIDYFSPIHNQKQLIALLEAWDFLRQGKCKLIRKDKIMPDALRDIIEKYSAPFETKKSYGIEDKCLNILLEYEQNINKIRI